MGEYTGITNTGVAPLHKYCRRCGKLLVSDESRIRGYGDECARKSQKYRHKKLFDKNKKSC